MDRCSRVPLRRRHDRDVSGGDARGHGRLHVGIWVAHGEGRAYFPEPSILKRVGRESLAPIRFVDDQGQVTKTYPFNPNGSPHGIAGLCTPDGRHLVLIPHPKRSFLKWQWGFMPEDWKRDLEVCPWLRMFQNTRSCCERTA